MKKGIFIIILLTVWNITSKAQVSVPFTLKQFIEQYGNALDEYLEADELNSNFIFDNYFINSKDTLFWPDNFDLEDRYIKHRLGPKELFHKFQQFRTLSAGSFSYSYREYGDINLIRNKSTRYFDKFRVLAKEKYIFSNSNFFGSDSIVTKSNYYDIVSWFNPDKSIYEYHINQISENQTPYKFSPDAVRLNAEYFSPSLQNSKLPISSSFGYGININSFWLIGGRNTYNYSFKTGLEFSSFNFKVNNYSQLAANNNLVDKDNYPFTLISNLKNLSQSLSFQLITLPVQVQLTKYFKNGRFSAGVFGGFNLHIPINYKTTCNSGDITYSGKYKFDFAADSILLDDLATYNFKTYSYKDLKTFTPKFNPLFLSTEIGGEFNWYLGKKWVANMNISYLKSLTPLYSNSNRTIAYDIVDQSANKTFVPAINSFLAANSEDHLNSFKIGLGICYVLEKPVIPHGKVGLRNNEITRMARNKLVLSSGSYSLASNKKNLNIIVSAQNSSLSGTKINYEYIGPTSKYFKQGKLNPAAKNGNPLSLLVPITNSGTKLFIEEPYGYDLKAENIPFSSTGGLYGEMKIFKCEDLWHDNDDQMNLKLSYERLTPLNIFLVDYKYSFDDNGIHRAEILSRLKDNVNQVVIMGESAVIYVISNQPEAYLIDKSTNLNELFEITDTKLQNTNDVTTNIEGLKSFLAEKAVNPRREIKISLFTSDEFVDMGMTVMEDFSRTLNIDNSFIRYSTFLHSYGILKSQDYEKSVIYLKNIGKVNE